MNRAGFTTIEVMIASVLIVALITAGTAGLRQMQILQQVADSRTSHSEVRSEVFAALSDKATCADHLGGRPIIGSPTTLPTDTDGLPIAVIPRIGDGTMDILVDGQPRKKSVLTKSAAADDGLVYNLRLKFSSVTPEETFKFGLGRATPTTRYIARLEIHGARNRVREGQALGSTDVVGPTTELFGSMPLAIELDNVNRIVSCTPNFDEMDDVLVGGLHTVRECMLASGMPLPTEAGLICRVPVPYPIQMTPGYAGAIPSCSSLTGGVFTEVTATPPNYNTTIPIRMNPRKCSGHDGRMTGWHTMGAFDVEKQPLRIKKGSKDTVKVLLGGAAIAATVGDVIFPGLGFAIASTLATIAFVISLFHKCHDEDFTEWAQVTSVGCK